MPTITPTPVPTAGLIQVDVDWSDDPTIAYARLERVTVATGERATVRPHTAVNAVLGQFMMLSGGRGRWFDTDAPMDTPVTYRVYSDADPLAPVEQSVRVADLFTRVAAAAANWGTATTGQAWVTVDATNEMSVNGTRGVVTLAAANLTRRNVVTAAGLRRNWDVRTDTTVPVLPVGASAGSTLYARRIDVSNGYNAAILWAPGSTTQLQINRTVAGVTTGLVNTAGPAYAAGTLLSMRFQVIESVLRLRVWLTASDEPTTWDLEVEDFGVTAAGHFGAGGATVTSLSNLPYAVHFDNLAANGWDAEHPSPQTVLPSNGNAWLRDPLRPCHNVELLTCVEVGACADSNLGFDVGTTSRWSATSGTLTVVTTPTFGSAYAGQLVATAGVDPRVEYATGLAVTPGRWVWAKGWLRLDQSGRTLRITVNWYDGAGVYLSTATGGEITSVAGQWQFAQLLTEAPASAATARWMAVVDAGHSAGDVLLVDGGTLDYREPASRGAFFAAMGAEERDSNSSTVAPVNRQLGVSASRPRRGISSDLTIVTADFRARDAVVTLLAAGTPVLFSAPAAYGIPDQHMDVGRANVQRGMPDHRFQPRVHSLPYSQVEAAAGPGKGPCGAQFGDWCATAVVTWDQAVTAGLTYNDTIDVS